MANEFLKSYSFLDTNISFVSPTGAFPIGLGAEDGGITVTMNNDKDTMQVGADGSYMHSLHADRSGVVTVTLLKNSPDNALLNAMYNAQATSAALWGQNVINIVTSNGDAVVCTGGAFKKQPNVQYGKDAAALVWELNFGNITEVLAGSI